MEFASRKRMLLHGVYQAAEKMSRQAEDTETLEIFFTVMQHFEGSGSIYHRMETDCRPIRKN